MGYACRVERHSVSPAGDELLTFVITFPRRVLAEAVTHRRNSDVWGDLEVSWCERNTTHDVSKNSASSRAIPFPKMLEKIRSDPFEPMWTENRRGMQGDYLSADKRELADAVWRYARDEACVRASQLHSLGVHKQDCNRLLEPFAWVTQAVTSSRWDNYFALRCDEACEPHLRHISRMMYLRRRKSTPEPLDYGQWHLPFVPPEEQRKLFFVPSYALLVRGDKIDVPDLIKHSAARCAWVSYESHDKDGSPEAMMSTFDRLMSNSPVHASPSEHQGTPMPEHWERELPRLVSNLPGWLQHRKLVRNESASRCVFSDEELASWGMPELM
jgi:hypothetical protein